MNKVIYTLCGPAANGKSTYTSDLIKEKLKENISDDLENILQNITVLNADTIRKELYGDPTIQGDGMIVFNKLFDEYVSCLKDDYTELIIIDNTSLTYKIRKRYFRLANTICPMFEHTFKYNLVFFNVPIEQALIWNASRDRHVPEDVIIDQYKRYQHATIQECASEINSIELEYIKNGN